MVLKAFREAASKAPTYQILLKKRGVSPKKILTLEEFKRFVPAISKEDVRTQHITSHAQL